MEINSCLKIPVENGQKTAIVETNFAQNCVQNTLRVGFCTVHIYRMDGAILIFLGQKTWNSW